MLVGLVGIVAGALAVGAAQSSPPTAPLLQPDIADTSSAASEGRAGSEPPPPSAGAAPNASLSTAGPRGGASEPTVIPSTELNPSTESNPTNPAIGDPAASGPDPGDDILAWTSGGLPAGAAARIGALPDVTSTIVLGDRVDLAASHTVAGDLVDGPTDGFAIPLDAIAIDPDTYPPFVLDPDDAQLLAGLGASDAALGATSASLRRLGPGDILTLVDGTKLTVAGIVADESIGAAEIVVIPGAVAQIATPRYALVRDGRDGRDGRHTDNAPEGLAPGAEARRAEIEHTLSGAIASDGPIRFRARGETPWLRQGDAVLPQSIVKARFGEFAYRRTGPGSRTIEQDPVWMAANIVEIEVPILGSVRCHRSVAEVVRAALSEALESGLAPSFAGDGFLGCWNPRLVNASDSAGISRHAWGIAFDVNAADNVRGRDGAQDPRVIDLLARHGFTNGGPWLVPDAVHFEWVGR